MIRFERFTTEYDPVEDRVRISGQAQDGARATAWLNLRMLRLLVPALAGWIERRDQPVGAGMGASAAAASAVQQFHHAAAVAAFTAGQGQMSPIPSIEPGLLAVSVDYTDLGGAMRLVFKDHAGHAFASVDFPAPALRQWLGIICNAHTVAGWPMDGLPSWLLPFGDPDAPPN